MHLPIIRNNVNSRYDNQSSSYSAPTCPDCGSLAHYSAGCAVVRCPSCGFVVYLTPAENRDVLDVVLGVSTTPLDQFIAEISRQRTPETAVA